MIHRLIANIVSWMPERFIWLFSNRYIAGKKLSDAVAVTESLNNRSVKVTIDVLGEHIKSLEEAQEYKKAFLKTIGAIEKNELKATISVKPTMFGLLIDQSFCYEQIREVVQKARKTGIAVCMDMEDSSCTDIELDMFERLYSEFPENISFVLQAYLRRTISDIRRLALINNPEYPIDIRICKGIYVEPKNLAYKSKNAINKNYLLCLDTMLQNKFFCSIATHDKSLIAGAEKLLKQYSTDKSNYEFQMLYGVLPDLRNKILKNGHPIRVYVPYGEHWFNYSTRRLKENPRMVSHIIKALFVSG